MSSAQSNDPPLAEAHLVMLRMIYHAFVEATDWPTAQYVDSVAWDKAPHDTYNELSEMGLVRPTIRPGEHVLRGDAKVEVSLDGLVHLVEAAGDVERFVACVRYLADRASAFRPSSPTVFTQLEISSEEIGAALGLQSSDAAITRLGWLVSQASLLWTSFSGPSGGQWGLAVKIENARRFREINSLADYLRLAEPVYTAATPPAEPGFARLNKTATSRDAEPSAHRQRPNETNGSSRLQFDTSVIADVPAKEDLLGVGPLVKALCGLLNDRNTVLPLAIAITAPWGSGKSSVMEQVKEQLGSTFDGKSPQRTWVTVRFDAWKYERGERLWAALAKAIYSQPQWQMKWWERLYFRTRLERRRRGWVGTILTLAWPSLAIAAMILTATTANISGVSTLPIAIGAAAGILGTVTRYGNMLANPFQRAIDRHASRPDYEAQLGFTADADRDIRALTKLLAPDDHHCLAVFVDDLDRCSSAHVVEIVEAMNQIFNSAHDRRCVFVLGLDRDVVASSINAAYADTLTHLHEQDRALSRRFGSEFLTKLVQLSVSLPEPSEEALERLLQAITGDLCAPPDSLAIPASDDEIERAQTVIQTASGPTLASVTDAAAAIIRGATPSAVVTEAARRELAERIESSREVAEAEFSVLPYLARNPRQVKRFHNAFRLQLYVANEDDDLRFAFTTAELIALARWVVVRLRWPDFGTAIAQSQDLLLALEATINEEVPHASPAAYKDAGLIEACEHWLEESDLRAVMTEPDPARRLSAIELKTFLRVT